MKKIFKKFLIWVLALTMLLSMMQLPISAATNISNASSSELTEEQIETLIKSKRNQTDQIVQEIETERTEFSKTYLLEDGSYYSVSSDIPIHRFSNNKWIEIQETNSTEPKKINDANNQISSLSNYTKRNKSKSTSIQTDNAFDIQCVGNAYLENEFAFFTLDGGVLVKPKNIYNYTGSGKLITRAEISADIYYSNDQAIIAREVDSDWSTYNSTSDLIDNQIISYKSIPGGEVTNISFNVTDIFSKWERETIAQNGIFINIDEQGDGEYCDLSNLSLQVWYIDVSENQAKFTTHSVDMSLAGIVNVNDVTNTLTLTQNIIGIDTQTLPVNITKAIDITNNDFSNVAGINSNWNYSNKISLEGDILTWEKFDGSIIKFQQPTEDIVVDNNYQKWLPLSNDDLESTTEAWIHEDIADSDGLNTDYSQCYINNNQSRYYFTMYGEISSIEKHGKNITFSYNNLGLYSIIDTLGNKYIFTYSRYTVGIDTYYYVSKISVKDQNNNLVVVDGKNYEITFSNDYNSTTQRITTTTTYPSGKTVEHTFDLNGRLCEIVNESNERLVINYRNEYSSIVNTYYKYAANSETTLLNGMSIVSQNTFSRVFKDNNDKVEVMRFDKKYNLITDYYQGNIVSIDYDDDGNKMKSYAIKDINNYTNDTDITNLISNGTFDTQSDITRYGSLTVTSVNGRAQLTGELSKNGGVVCKANVEEVGNQTTWKTISKDTIYVIEAEAWTTNVQTDTDGFFGIMVQAYTKINSRDVLQETFLYEFDTSLKCNYPESDENFAQTRMIATSFDEDYLIKISVVEMGLLGTFEVDNVKMYEAVDDVASVGLPAMDNASPINKTYTDDNQLSTETITHGTSSMIQSYNYSNDDKKNLISMTDYNGVKTYYKYDTNTNKLIAKGHEIDENGEIIDPTQYAYDSNGLLQFVSQTVSDVVDTDKKTTYSSEFVYNGNKVSSVTHNGTTYEIEYNENDETSTVNNISTTNTKYDIAYNDAGNISNITKTNLDGSENPVAQLLNQYSYGQPIESAETFNDEIIFENGFKIVYTIDKENSYVTTISYQKLSETGNVYEEIDNFAYSYDEFGNLSTINVTHNNVDNHDVSNNDSSDFSITYTENGYSLSKTSSESNTENILLYEKIDSASTFTERHLSAIDGQSVYETFTQNKFAFLTDEITGETTGNSLTTGSKRSAFFDDTMADYSLNNRTTADQFDRLTKREIHMTTDVTNATNEVREAEANVLQLYSYKTDVTLDGNITTNLVSSINTSITGHLNVDGEVTNHLRASDTHYIYDDHGRVQLVYDFNNIKYQLVGFYAYDEAGQIITECFDTGFYQYSYNSNGNLSKRYIYDIDEPFTFNNITSEQANAINCIDANDWNTFDFTEISTKSLSINATPIKTVELTYEGDQVKSFTEKTYTYTEEIDSNGETYTKVIETISNVVQISYDEYGNPLKNIDYNVVDMIVSDLGWSGNLLTSVITYDPDQPNVPSKKYIYKYDENGYRIEKIQYEILNSDNGYTYNKELSLRYIWDNGSLRGIRMSFGNEEYYSNMLYDEKGVPCGYVDFTGNPYYFIRDINNSVTGLVSGDGNLAVSIIYDAFGRIKMDAYGSNILESTFYAILAQLNPCSFKGYLYDYETGMFFIKNRCYSPTLGKFIDNNLDTVTETCDNPIQNRPSVFCSNNPNSNDDLYGSWDYDKQLPQWNNETLTVNMSKAFLSATFCSMYANQLVKEYGSFDPNLGYTVYGMDVERIASNLYARSVGKYAEGALNKVNVTWGKGWIQPNRNGTKIIISSFDEYAIKYLRIWYAAENIRREALKEGIFLAV